jgi:hypothetical protein
MYTPSPQRSVSAAAGFTRTVSAQWWEGTASAVPFQSAKNCGRGICQTSSDALIVAMENFCRE